MSLHSTERDAQIMELRMRGFTATYVPSHRPDMLWRVPDGVSGTHKTEDEAWDAAIAYAAHGIKPYGDVDPFDSNVDWATIIRSARGGAR